MKWFQRKTQKQTTHNESENQKILQVITGENLIEILNLWKEFSNWREQSPPQIVTGILAKMVGLIMNDTVWDSAGIVNPSQKDPSRPYTTLVLNGESSAFLRVRLYNGHGITIDQLISEPHVEDLLKDPEDWVYYTLPTNHVEGTTKLLNLLYPQRKFIFVYGTDYFKEPCTNRKIYLSSPDEDPNNLDSFLIVKDCYANSNRDTISWEFVWGNGDIYAMQQPINKPFKPNLVKIEKSLL
jgi:hypothetical protein